MAESTLHEEWRPVLEWEDRYEVSNLGQVRSIPAHLPGRTRLRTLAQCPQIGGYPFVCLCRNRKRKRAVVHRLVLLAFRGRPAAGHSASHLDGSVTNCRLDNLVWESHARNCLRKREHGTVQAGARNATAKLTWAIVDAIRAEPNGHSTTKARLYGISTCHYSHIRNGKGRWQVWKEENRPKS